jgi:phosphonoacetaldehyde hydrolase
MVFRNMELTGVYPAACVVKVGDTLPDIGEGRNAGTWTIGLSATGNEVGLNEGELGALPEGQRKERISRAEKALYDAGAHAVVPSIAEVPAAVEAIDRRLAAGEAP